MKILYVNSFYDPHIGGGAEITLKSICDGISAKGHSVVVAATALDRNIEFVDGVKVYRVPYSNIYWNFRRQFPNKVFRLAWYCIDVFNPFMLRKLRRIVKQELPDVIVCHNLAGWSMAPWRVGKKLDIPVIQVMHDSYLACPSSLMFKNGKSCVKQCVSCRILRGAHPILSRDLTAAVGVSEYILQRFVSLGFFRGVFKQVIRNGKNVHVEAVKAGKPAGKVCSLGFIGSITPAKGLEWMLDEISCAGLTNPIVIAGEGSELYLNLIKQKYAHLDLTFLGRVPQHHFFSMIDICIIPSLWNDTFPGVAIEASMYRTPVVASNRGGLPEIVKDGENGLLCDPDEKGSLAAAVKRLCDQPSLRTAMKERCAQVVSPLLSASRMVDEYEELYKRVIMNYERK